MMKFNISSKIFWNVDSFVPMLKRWRENNEIIVFTNGCFDIIHQGHVYSLMQSSNYGSKLVVGLNADESVKRIKGEERPVLDQRARAYILSAFVCVDAVVVFNDSNPKKIIKKIAPDILVKGEDYRIDEIVGAKEVIDWGGRVERVKLIKGISTSKLINKIKKIK